MLFEVNYLVVIAAAVATMLLGALWFGTLFGKACFAVTIGLTAHPFSDRKSAAYLIPAAYLLVYLLIMGAILGGWG